jgi:hypothetical protein
VQICIKFGAGEQLFQGSKDGYVTQIPDLARFAEICLSDSHIVNAITSSILGVSLCMSIWSEFKVYRAPWSTPCPQLSSGEVSISVATRLIEHNLVKSSLT